MTDNEIIIITFRNLMGLITPGKLLSTEELITNLETIIKKLKNDD